MRFQKRDLRRPCIDSLEARTLLASGVHAAELNHFPQTLSSADGYTYLNNSGDNLNRHVPNITIASAGQIETRALYTSSRFDTGKILTFTATGPGGSFKPAIGIYNARTG